MQPLMELKRGNLRVKKCVLAVVLAHPVLAVIAVITGHAWVMLPLAASFLSILLGYPWIVGDLERVTLTDRLRHERWPDKLFVALRDGVTHYELAGPEDGSKVVLVTGLASPFFIWDYQFHVLADAGFRVLRYDNFGRGLSDRPRVPYNEDTFDTQLLGLLDALGWTRPVDLVGLSMGGTTVARFVDRHPERAARYVLIAPAGLPSPTTFRGKLLGYAGVGEWLMKAFGDEGIISALPREIGDDPQKNKQAVDAYLGQMQFRGYKRGMLQTIRNNPMNNLLPVFERLGARARPAMLLWGDRDTVVPFAHHTQIQAAIPGIRFHAIEGGTHPVCFQKPEMVNPLLLDFLKS